MALQMPDTNTDGLAVALPTMNLTQYAKRRGVSAMAVSRAVARGRLRDSVVRGNGGKAIGISDPELADHEWDANAAQPTKLNPNKVSPNLGEAEEPTANTSMSIAEAKEVEAYWKAKEAERKYKEATGKLVPAAEVEREWADILSQVRTKLLGIPSQVKQAIPTLSVPEIAAIEGMVRAALEDLTRG